MHTLQTEPPPSLTRPPRGPRWTVEPGPTQSGSLLIRDEAVGFVGVATDPLTGGKRDQDAVERRATMMALSPLMLDACRLLVQARPLTVARLERLGGLPHQELIEAAELAAEAIAAMEALPLAGDAS